MEEIFFFDLIKEHNRKDYDKWFKEIANQLMNHCCIKTGKAIYRIIECEVYYDNKIEGEHSDPFIHKNPQQFQQAEWYFWAHGVDITFGIIAKVQASILIRGIKRVEIIGQQDTIADEYCISRPEIAMYEIVLNSFGSINNGCLLIEPYTYSTILEVTPTNRYGLKIKSEDNNKVEKRNFIDKPYRYWIEKCPKEWETKFYKNIL